MKHQHELVAAGKARWYRGRLIPVLRGGDPEADSPFPTPPEDLAALSDEDLETFISETQQAVDAVAAAPTDYVNDARTAHDLLAEMEASIEALEAAHAERESRAAEDAAEANLDETVAALADRARSVASQGEEEADPSDGGSADGADDEAEAAEAADAPDGEASVEIEPVVAAAPPRRPRLGRSIQSVPQDSTPEPRSMVAATGATGFNPGDELSRFDIARAMIAKRKSFGRVASDASENVPVARVDWSDDYPAERRLGGDEIINSSLIASAIDERQIRENLRKRVKDDPGGLTASGGLCAPLTPYYDLQVIATADRPVRAALPSFGADRGGIRFASPAGLGSITTAVDTRTASQDAGTTAAKSCQTIACPPFSDVTVTTIFHCLTFGNLGARTFPELVSQWNELVLAAHARIAESALLTAIGNIATTVTANDTADLGAAADLLTQVLTAASGMRSRNRMNPEAVLRLMLPFWAVDLMVSDVLRSQFERFDTDRARLTALLRSFNVEPTFYIDGASGAGQVFGAQADGAGLIEFPTTVRWYLFPEGSFLYLDGGVLELGLVRDSVLNNTNDFQIFGESFENVAFVGVEALEVTSTTCNNGAVAAPKSVGCPEFG